MSFRILLYNYGVKLDHYNLFINTSHFIFWLSKFKRLHQSARTINIQHIKQDFAVEYG